MPLESSSSEASHPLARVQNILLRPKLEWPVIEAEHASLRSIFVPYAVLLTAIGPIAGLIGGQLMGIFRLPLLTSFIVALLGWGLSLVMAYVVTLLIEALSPKFGGEKNRIGAAKIAVYGSTASWVAGIFSLFPPLAWLGLVGLYSLYLVYLGLPVVLKVPKDKVIIFMIVIAVIVVILSMIIGAITSTIIASSLVGSMAMSGVYGL